MPPVDGCAPDVAPPEVTVSPRTLSILALVLGAVAGGLALAGADLGLPPGVVAGLNFVLTTVAAGLGYSAPNGQTRAQAELLEQLSKEGP